MPSVRLIAKFGDAERGLTISELAPLLREHFAPSRADLSNLSNRRDDRLSQIIRNLVSHRTLERKGLALYFESPGRPGHYRLTELGWRKAREALYE